MEKENGFARGKKKKKKKAMGSSTTHQGQQSCESMQQQNFQQQQQQKETSKYPQKHKHTHTHTHKTPTSLLKTHLVWMMDEIHPCVAISDWSTSCVSFFAFPFLFFSLWGPVI